LLNVEFETWSLPICTNIMELAAVNALQLAETALLSPQDRIEAFLQSLPVLDKDSDLVLEDSCPICLMPFSSIFTEDCSAEPEIAGVTKLIGCGHIFCRRE
jgi:hypothetical protein